MEEVTQDVNETESITQEETLDEGETLEGTVEDDGAANEAESTDEQAQGEQEEKPETKSEPKGWDKDRQALQQELGNVRRELAELKAERERAKSEQSTKPEKETDPDMVELERIANLSDAELEDPEKFDPMNPRTVRAMAKAALGARKGVDSITKKTQEELSRTRAAQVEAEQKAFAEKLVKDTGRPLDEAKAMIDEYNAAMPAAIDGFMKKYGITQYTDAISEAVGKEVWASVVQKHPLPAKKQEVKPAAKLGQTGGKQVPGTITNNKSSRTEKPEKRQRVPLDGFVTGD